MKQIFDQLNSRKSELEFRLTDEQASLVGTWFEREYGVLTRTLGENFHPSIVRMGITTMRTLDKWLSDWCADGSIAQPRYGCYQKRCA